MHGTDPTRLTPVSLICYMSKQVSVLRTFKQLQWVETLVDYQRSFKLVKVYHHHFKVLFLQGLRVRFGTREDYFLPCCEIHPSRGRNSQEQDDRQKTPSNNLLVNESSLCNNLKACTKFSYQPPMAILELELMQN